MKIISEMPAAEYHATDAISKSGLDRMNQSAAHFISWRNEPQKSSPALEIGTATHTAVLEPDLLKETYHIGKIDRRTKEGKAQADEIEASGKRLLSEEDFGRVMRIRDSVFSHPTAQDLFSCGNAEVTLMGEFQGVKAKARIDWLINLQDTTIVVDLKTTECASPEEFAKSCAKYRYHVQAAWYSDLLKAAGLEAQAFYFVVVEKSAPYAVAVYELDAEAVQLGRDAYQRNLDTYKACLERNEWPAYSQYVESLSLPRWAFNQAA